jgi:hypothetical protein
MIKTPLLFLMQNPFAIAAQWPDDPRRFLVRLQRPYFTAALCETIAATWLLVSWSPGMGLKRMNRASLFRAAAKFCRTQLDQWHVPIRFVEKKHGHHLPRYLIAQTPAKELFIIEPDHSTPLVEVRDSATGGKSERTKRSQRFDVITEWRLGQMRKYYQQFLERQKSLTDTGGAVTAP